MSLCTPKLLHCALSPSFSLLAPPVLPLLAGVEEGVQRALEAAGQVAVPPEALHRVAVVLGRPLRHHQGRLLQGRG